MNSEDIPRAFIQDFIGKLRFPGEDENETGVQTGRFSLYTKLEKAERVRFVASVREAVQQGLAFFGLDADIDLQLISGECLPYQRFEIRISVFRAFDLAA